MIPFELTSLIQYAMQVANKFELVNFVGQREYGNYFRTTKPNEKELQQIIAIVHPHPYRSNPEKQKRIFDLEKIQVKCELEFEAPNPQTQQVFVSTISQNHEIAVGSVDLSNLNTTIQLKLPNEKRATLSLCPTQCKGSIRFVSPVIAVNFKDDGYEPAEIPEGGMEHVRLTECILFKFPD